MPAISRFRRSGEEGFDVARPDARMAADRFERREFAGGNPASKSAGMHSESARDLGRVEQDAAVVVAHNVSPLSPDIGHARARARNLVVPDSIMSYPSGEKPRLQHQPPEDDEAEHK